MAAVADIVKAVLDTHSLLRITCASILAFSSSFFSDKGNMVCNGILLCIAFSLTT